MSPHRRPRFRTAVAACEKCSSRVTVDISPRAYVLHVAKKELTDPAWKGRCPCGERLKITVGEVFRAA